MQLNKKITLPLAVIASTTFPMILNAASGSEISAKQMSYQESDDRVKVDYTLLDLKQEIGADYTASVSLSYDSISGGTPIWLDTYSGASGIAGEDGKIHTYNEDKTLDYGGIDWDNGGIPKTVSNYEVKNVEIEDQRRSVSANLTKRTPSRDEITFGTSYSKEEDFTSKEISTSYLYNLDSSRNRSITLGVSYQKNEAYHLMYKDWKEFDVVNAQIGYTHTFTKYTVGQINLFNIHQSGELSNAYQTILRNFSGEIWRAVEKRPDEKNSRGITMNLVSKVLDNVAWHNDYRLYKDDWDVLSHTVSTGLYIDLPYKFTISPLLRYYTQTEAEFYKDYDEATPYFNETENGSSDERLGKYHSYAYNLTLGKKFTDLLSASVQYGHQTQSFGLKMDWVALGLNYSF